MFSGISHVFRCQTIYIACANYTCTSSIPCDTTIAIYSAVNLLTKTFRPPSSMTRSFFSAKTLPQTQINFNTIILKRRTERKQRENKRQLRLYSFHGCYLLTIVLYGCFAIRPKSTRKLQVWKFSIKTKLIFLYV